MIQEYSFNGETKSTKNKHEILNLNLGAKISKKLNLLNLSKTIEYFQKNQIFAENFELLNFFDYGSESIVYKCIHRNTNKKLVAKIIVNKKEKKINENELLISSKMKNKNIINSFLYSNIVKDKPLCLIMEDARYGNLNNFKRNILKRLYLSETLICYLTSQILNGLLYCYKCKIAHMDIKPKNIVIDEFLNAKLIDFSISINYHNKKPYEQIKLPMRGTSLYIPLEVLVSQRIKYRDLHKIDLYSLGVKLYNLASGKYPYDLTYEDENDYSKIIQKIFINKVGINESKKEFSPHFFDFLNKLLIKDINKRINIVDIQNHFWIKGSKILIDEKENLNDTNLFLYHLLTDHIKAFNKYLGK